MPGGNAQATAADPSQVFATGAVQTATPQYVLRNICRRSGSGQAVGRNWCGSVRCRVLGTWGDVRMSANAVCVQ